jgi:hypothetical protein
MQVRHSLCKVPTSAPPARSEAACSSAACGLADHSSRVTIAAESYVHPMGEFQSAARLTLIFYMGHAP